MGFGRMENTIKKPAVLQPAGRIFPSVSVSRRLVPKTV